MEIRLFQWLVPLVVVVFLLSNLLRYYRGRIDLRESIFVSILWIGIALIAIFPDLTSNFLAELLGFKSNTNAILFLGLGVLFYFQYRLYRIQIQYRRDLTELTRSIALMEYDKAKQDE